MTRKAQQTISLSHGSLFSGGGGFDIAAEAMGWTNVFHVENDLFCNRVLNHYWPNAKSFGDIQHFDATPFKGQIDILTGGFPCQPFSLAGRRKGTADTRHLWPEMLRVIREIQTRWVVAENVYGILSWNGGMVFEQVQADLEREGYEVQAYVLPATGVNAPHRRYRVWFVGRRKNESPAFRAEDNTNANSDGQQRCDCHNEKQSDKAGQHDTKQVGCHAAHSSSKRLERWKQSAGNAKSQKKTLKRFAQLRKPDMWHSWPTQPALCSGDDGLPTELDGITVPRWRRESIKMYGNAVVPQVVLQLFKVIERMEGKA
jgi:DNA (cytosine-5)-methyltransferase 1